MFASFFEPRRDWVVVVAGVIVVGALGMMTASLCQRQAEDARVRDAALPRCVERLHDEQDCRRRIAIGHADCAIDARFFPSRGQGAPSFLDQEKYLECIILSPSGWAEKRRLERAAQEAERERDLSGH